MKTLEEVLEMVQTLDQSLLETYVARGWIKPARQQSEWRFAEIDIARLELVRYLAQEIAVNDEGMDVVLSLLDQLYGVRARLQTLAQAIAQQPEQVRQSIGAVIKKDTPA